MQLLQRKIDQQDGVLANDAEQHQQADIDWHRNRLTHDQQRDQAAERGQQQGPHIDQRRHEPFVEQHQHGKHQQHTGNHRDDDIGDQLTLPFLRPERLIADALRQIGHDRQRIDLRIGRARHHIRCQIRAHEHAALLIIALNGGGTGAEAQIGNARQRHGATARRRHGQIFDRVQAFARCLRQHDADRDLPIGQGEARRVLVDFAQSGDADGLAQRRRGHTERSGQLGARRHDEFGPLQIGRNTRALYGLQPLHLLHQRGGGPAEQFRVGAGQHDRYFTAGATAAAILRAE